MILQHRCLQILLLLQPRNSTGILSFSGSSIMSGSGDPIAQKKRGLRSEIRKSLKALHPNQRAQQDAAIQNLVVSSPWFKSSTSLCAYISCGALREVDTSNILSHILNDPHRENTQIKKNLFVPRVEDKSSHMRMLKISNLEDLVANSMSILEPNPIDTNGNPCEDVMLASDPVDLFLLPGVAFDEHGRRLGRGGGYYDAFLKKYQQHAVDHGWRQPLLVGLAYSVQILESGVIPVTMTDIPVDAVVHPSGVIKVSSQAMDLM